MNKQKLMAIVLAMAFAISFLSWGLKERKVESISGRIPIWQQTIRLCNEHPWKGWGIGTYKDVFFPLSKLHCFGWREAHNFIFQLCFEVGYPVTGGILLALGWLVWILYTSRQWLCLSGISMIIMDSLAHFPDRMLQTVPLIVIFLAYCNFCLKKDTPCPCSLHS